jgi:hypothetical protein
MVYSDDPTAIDEVFAWASRDVPRPKRVFARVISESQTLAVAGLRDVGTYFERDGRTHVLQWVGLSVSATLFDELTAVAVALIGDSFDAKILRVS